jgi:hypothetical protein
MEPQSGKDHPGEGSIRCPADFLGHFNIAATQRPFDPCHEFRPFGSGAFSVIKDPFHKNRDGYKRTEE